MRIYNRDDVCGFRFTRAAWGEFSNFAPLAAPIAAGPWTFTTSEALYQAAKFGAAPRCNAASPAPPRRARRPPSGAARPTA